MYDAAPTPTNASQFLRIDGIDLVINCKRCMPHAQALSLDNSDEIGSAGMNKRPLGVAVRAAMHRAESIATRIWFPQTPFLLYGVAVQGE